MDTLRNVPLISAKGEIVHSELALRGKNIVAYYFSASWCGPCKILLPQLIKIYQENIKRRCGLEIIYVSSDNDKAVFLDYFYRKHGGWFAIPFGDPIADELRLKYNVTNIPSIVVVRKDGMIISNRGRQDIEEIGLNVLVTWTE